MRFLPLTVLAMLCLTNPALAAPMEPFDDVDVEEEEYSNESVVDVLVISVSTDYEKTRDAAIEASRLLGFAYTDGDHIFDEKGLRLPDDYDDEIFAGGYVYRRFDDVCRDDRSANGCVTVERASAYGIVNTEREPEAYVAVGGLWDPKISRQRLVEVRRMIPAAYLVRTTVYVGCMH